MLRTSVPSSAPSPRRWSPSFATSGAASPRPVGSGSGSWQYSRLSAAVGPRFGAFGCDLPVGQIFGVMCSPELCGLTKVTEVTEVLAPNQCKVLVARFGSTAVSEKPRSERKTIRRPSGEWSPQWFQEVKTYPFLV